MPTAILKEFLFDPDWPTPPPPPPEGVKGVVTQGPVLTGRGIEWHYFRKFRR